MGYKKGKKIDTDTYMYCKRDIIKNLQDYIDKNQSLCRFCGAKIKVINFTQFFLGNCSIDDEEIIDTKCGCGNRALFIPFSKIGGCYCYNIPNVYN